MRTLQLIRASKRLIGGDKWATGKMPKSAFQLSKANSYSLGSGWCWNTYDVEGDDARFKMLVAYHIGKEQYRAWLGLQVGSDLAILARLEYHPDEDHGWHCHTKRGHISDVAVGVVKQPRYRDRARRCRSSREFSVSSLNALQIACRLFNIEPAYSAGELLK